MHRFSIAFCAAFSLFTLDSFGDGPEDNDPAEVRPIPPPGIELHRDQEDRIRRELQTFGKAITALRERARNEPLLITYLPDVEICHNAVENALKYNEFYREKEIDFAEELLDIGQERARQLSGGKIPWTREAGLVFRGYRSQIDQSVQPYGLEIPEDYDFDSTAKWRLDFWFHGRGEKLSELAFIQQRHLGRGGKISPKSAIVLHPYARYSNANKFAGEVDLFEAFASAEKDYKIDREKILIRGFSMGGAACWQYAVHHADLWAAAQPGAGFSETPEFLKTFQGETLTPAPWEEKLWRWYDATNWALNLTSVPTKAYSGENDRQKQAADMMVAAAAEENLRLVHIIGPGTEHKIHPDSLSEIEHRLDSIVENRHEETPESVCFVTYTLRYNRMHWLRVDGMTKHWEQARLEARIQSPSKISVSTKGVEAFSIHFESGECPLQLTTKPTVAIDGTILTAPKVWSDRSWEVAFERINGQWQQRKTVPRELRLLTDSLRPEDPAPSPDFSWRTDLSRLQKRHGLQGPIDDAFMDPFIFIEPDGAPLHIPIENWVQAEMNRARTHWRKTFRGQVIRRPASRENSVSRVASENRNRILWGDPECNSEIEQFLATLDHLPIHWDRKSLTIGRRIFDSKHHILAMIYPDPASNRYIVLNSSFTFRDYDYLNNARQTPKLPDWAVIDVREAPGNRYPGKIVAAEFFDENWMISTQSE